MNKKKIEQKSTPKMEGQKHKKGDQKYIKTYLKKLNFTLVIK